MKRAQLWAPAESAGLWHRSSLVLYALSIENFARQFNKKPINVDGDLKIDFEGEFRVDNSAYDRYRSDYIKSPGSPEKLFWDIVADSIGSKAC